MNRRAGDAPVMPGTGLGTGVSLNHAGYRRSRCYGTVNHRTANLSGFGSTSGAGFAVDAVERRPRDAPVIPDLLAVKSGGRQLERELHARFADLRERGEWFRDHPDLRAYMADETRLIDQEGAA